MGIDRDCYDDEYDECLQDGMSDDEADFNATYN